MPESLPPQKTKILKNGLILSIVYSCCNNIPFNPPQKIGLAIYLLNDDGGHVQLKLQDLGINGYEVVESPVYGYLLYKDELLDIIKQLEKITLL